MATPIGHSLFGLVGAQLGGTQRGVPAWRWYLLAILAANAPDLDFFAGLLVGDINHFHQGPSHSLAAALLFGLLAASLAGWYRRSPLYVGTFGATLYASHLLMDFFSHDGRPPFGQPLLWPFTDAHWIAPQPLFPGGVRHGDPGDGLAVVIEQVFSWHNLGVVALEAALLLPLFAAGWYLARQRQRSARALPSEAD